MKLQVPYRKQQREISCFPACIRMVLKYYGEKIDEKWLHSKGLPEKEERDLDYKRDTIYAKILHKKNYKITSYWNGNIENLNLSKKRYKAYKKEYETAVKKGILSHKRNASVKTIKNYLNKKIPLIAEVLHRALHYGKYHVWDHKVIITGYDKKYFYINDPDKWEGEKNKKIPIKEFLERWEYITPKSGRMLFIIEK